MKRNNEKPVERKLKFINDFRVMFLHVRFVLRRNFVIPFSHVIGLMDSVKNF